MINYKEQNEKIVSFLDEIYNTINEVGRAYHNRKAGEIGIVKTTFLSIIERVARNIHGIYNLLQHPDNHLQQNRQPIMLLLRGIVEDLWLGAYLIRLKDDEVSFINELRVIDLQYAKFSEFLIEREPYFAFASAEFKGLENAEIEKLIREKIIKFQKENAVLYKTDNNQKVVRKSAGELRSSSNPVHLNLIAPNGETADWNSKKYTVSLLHEIIEFIQVGDKALLQLYSYTYLLYRALSQYQHFSLDVSMEMLNRDEEYEMSLIVKSTGAMYMMLTRQLVLLGMDEMQTGRLEEALKKYTS